MKRRQRRREEGGRKDGRKEEGGEGYRCINELLLYEVVIKIGKNRLSCYHIFKFKQLYQLIRSYKCENWIKSILSKTFRYDNMIKYDNCAKFQKKRIVHKVLKILFQSISIYEQIKMNVLQE